MPLLYLLRHAKSDWADPGLADQDRPLAPRGRTAATLMAGHLATSDYAPPDLVLCSPALRTRQTLALIAPALSPQAQVWLEDDLYGASASELQERLRGLPAGTQAALVIGHNPGLHDLAQAIAGPAAPARLREKFPTCALAVFDVADWQHLGDQPAPLREFVTPATLEF